MYPFSKIEKKWQQNWLKTKVYEPDFKKAKKPFYNLMMFPYPSAEGLHVGNMYAFTGTDVYGRFKRMQGNDVFEPIGLDGFGIHSENYAIKIGKHPMDQAKVSQKNFYRQLQMIGNGYAWDEHLETYDPAYYKWTQWIFIRMFKAGLAYRKKSAVNWCPSCKTVLADEQVINGKCERCSSEVVKRDLEQWFFRITKYAGRLLKNIDKIDWSEKVKIAQRNWIGQSEGAAIKFPLIGIPGQPDKKHFLEVFTTRPDTLYGATFMVISPELAKSWIDTGWQTSDEVKKYIKKVLAERGTHDREAEPIKTGIDSGIKAVNPVNNEHIPVWVSDYVLAGYGTGAIMAVPAHDSRDFEFAKKFNLEIRPVIDPRGTKPVGRTFTSFEEEEKKIEPALKNLERIQSGEEPYVGSGWLINSGKFNGMLSEKAKDELTKLAGGEKKIQYRLRDWLISRQRYWGPPIPMIFCEECKSENKGERKEMPGWYTVPEKQLPVKLPYVKDFRPTGSDKSPLASVEKFYKVRCPGCKSWARRETDVSDTFLDSAWYYLRYPSTRSARSGQAPWDPVITKKWFPVDVYIGGAEHSVLHLLYVRFLAMVFKDLKLVHFEEPFPKFRAHGLIIKDGAKMSKSKGNVINPDDYIKNFGADALRMYLMFLGPFEDGGDFSDTGIRGVIRFLNRVWDIGKDKKFGVKKDSILEKALHRAIKKLTDGIDNLGYNTSIATLMSLLNEFEKKPYSVTKEQFTSFLKLLAPFAPHITEELWAALGGKGSIHKALWPKYNPKLSRENAFELLIQVNGKLRAKVTVDSGITEAQAKEVALSNEAVKRYLSKSGLKKVIFVPNRLINLVG